MCVSHMFSETVKVDSASHHAVLGFTGHRYASLPPRNPLRLIGRAERKCKDPTYIRFPKTTVIHGILTTLPPCTHTRADTLLSPGYGSTPAASLQGSTNANRRKPLASDGGNHSSGATSGYNRNQNLGAAASRTAGRAVGQTGGGSGRIGAGLAAAGRTAGRRENSENLELEDKILEDMLDRYRYVGCIVCKRAGCVLSSCVVSIRQRQFVQIKCSKA